MSEFDKIKKAIKIRNILTDTQTTLLTPNLGKGFHLRSSYYRFQFISKVIEYMVYIKATYGIEEVHGDVILDAVCKNSYFLQLFPTYNQLKLLLIEISLGLGLLDVIELGTIKVSNPLHNIDKSQPDEIEKFLGYNFKLSAKGWDSYSKQEYQILASNLFAARLSRWVSYIAVIISLTALFIRCFK